MNCKGFINLMTILSLVNSMEVDPEYERAVIFTTLENKQEDMANATTSSFVSEPIPPEFLDTDNSLFYDKYCEEEYLKNLNERVNETLILLGKDGFMHKFTAFYLQRRMLNLVIPIANAYTVYLKKKAVKKIHETEADFRYNANKSFLKKLMIHELQHYYFELIFNLLPKLKYKVLDDGIDSMKGKMKRKHYQQLWDWETNFTCHFRDIANHLTETRNYLLDEADRALYASMKQAYYQVELNNIAYTAPAFEQHHFQIKR